MGKRKSEVERRKSGVGAEGELQEAREGQEGAGTEAQRDTPGPEAGRQALCLPPAPAPLAPPTCHTGVHCTCDGLVHGFPGKREDREGLDTSQETGPVETLLDWLSWTYPVRRGVESVLEELGDGFLPLDRGMYGYKAAYLRGGVTVLYDGKPDMGVHVQVSGDGCREMEALGTEWVGFLRKLIEAGCKPRRIDLAVDERRGILELEVVRKALAEGQVVTKLKKLHDGTDKLIHGGDITGEKLALGARGGETFVRVYDKGLEQGMAGHWMRVELELRNKRAVAVAEEIVRSGSLEVTAAGVILATLDFKEPGGDSNSRRWRTADWWAQLLDAAKEKVHLQVPHKEQTLEDMERWVRKYVARILGLLLIAHGGDPRFLQELAADGAYRLKPHEIALVQRHLAERVIGVEGWKVNEAEEGNEEGEIPL